MKPPSDAGLPSSAIEEPDLRTEARATSASALSTFAQWQPRYAEYGLATFPVGGNKIPLVKHYTRIGLKASATLARKFHSAESFGLMVGERAGLTIVDMDSADKTLLEELLRRYGDTPLIVRTGGGKFHLWYRWDGERRRIRPFPQMPVDILGGGFILAPPSRAGCGYQFVRGSLQNVRSLPTICGASVRPGMGRVLPDGVRNDGLFSFALRQARHVDDHATLLDVVLTHNDHKCLPPKDETEVARIAGSAWGYEVSGRNFSGNQYVYATGADLDAFLKDAPDALALLLFLRRYHQGRPEFALGKTAARQLGWSLPRFRRARSRLERARRIHCLHPGGKGQNDPPLYRLVPLGE